MKSSTNQKMNKALDLLRIAVLECDEAGLGVAVSPMYNGGANWCIMISDERVTFDGHKFEIKDE